jgi:hypothetical protein
MKKYSYVNKQKETRCDSGKNGCQFAGTDRASWIHDGDREPIAAMNAITMMKRTIKPGAE